MRAHALLLVALVVLAGCVAPSLQDAAPTAQDVPAARPTLVGTGFHGVDAVEALQRALVAHPSGVADAFTIGKSVEGRDLLGVRVTAPGDASNRTRVLVDGGIHGNEVYGAEAAMYLAAWLTENHGRNATATRILETTDVRIVLLLNPDGRAGETRTNANGVDLNRNFDVDFGNPNPLCRSQTLSGDGPYYAGPAPLSEPETQALADLMTDFHPEIYLSHHTGRHALIRPWAACDPPQPMSAQDDAVFEAIEAWAREHTPYQNTGTAHETANRAFPPGAASGSSMDWCYLTYHCVAITAELTTAYGEGDEDPIEVVEAWFPITLHLLENAVEYAAWRVPG